MSRICFFDTECNTLDTGLGTIMELAWAVYDIETKRLLKSTSHLLCWGAGYTVDMEALAVTGLSREFCEANGRPAHSVFGDFLLDIERVDAVCGHNCIDYDIPMLRSNIKRTHFAEPEVLLNKFTFDTYFDLPIKNPRQIMTLKYLAMDHGYILSNAHEALADVFACAHVFFSYPFEECVARAKTPIVTAHTYSRWDEPEFHEVLRRQKFRWNRDSKRWERRCRAFYVPEAQLELGRDLFVGDKIIGKREQLPLGGLNENEARPGNS